MTFLTEENIKAEFLIDGTIKLLEDVTYVGDDKTYTVPKEYISDGASVPRALTWLLPKLGTYLRAALVHDYLITNGLVKKEFDIASNEVDKTFRQAMRDLGIPFARRWIMWSGVRLGAIGNKRRRKGSLKTLLGVLFIIILASPVLLIPSLIVQIFLALIWLITLPLPKQQQLSAQKM